jgi:EAL domain-containing protein (putative c-di-GMP-specific phosphodiesterase class I)
MIARADPRFDVVFCDLMMPEMDGIQMVRSVSALEVRPALVFLSAGDARLLDAAVDTGRARGVHVLGAVAKPLTVEAVRRVLANLADPPKAVRPRSANHVTPQDLDEALGRDQFHVHFQPKVSVIRREVTGFEALARWRHPDRGEVGPNDFIPVAEQCGRIAELTSRVFTLSLGPIARWRGSGLGVNLSVNLSPYMLIDLDLPDRLAFEVNQQGIDPATLILEITESGLFQDIADTRDILARLHMKGFALSIDDFGTGYSSMDQLRHVPFAEMKIDRAFVRAAGESAKAMAILDSSARLGRSLGMTVVAEGVETQGDWEAVETAGIDLVQGYLISRPMAPDMIPAWLEGWSAIR